jgi:hypothetical protein
VEQGLPAKTGLWFGGNTLLLAGNHAVLEWQLSHEAAVTGWVAVVGLPTAGRLEPLWQLLQPLVATKLWLKVYVAKPPGPVLRWQVSHTLVPALVCMAFTRLRA